MDYRLGAALLLSILLHALVLPGIGSFNLSGSPTLAKPAQLEIILAPAEAPKIHQKAATAANKSNAIEKRPLPKTSSPSSSEPQQRSAKATPRPLAPRIKEEQPMASANLSTATQPAASRSSPASSPVKANSPAPQSTLAAAPGKDSSKSLPSAQELIAALGEQLATGIQHYATQPSKRYIDSSTRDYAARAYLNNWCKKIERVGKMNYPEEANRQGIAGSLVVEVDLYPDGTIADIIIRQSSGYRALDEAAARIVQLAAPFAKVPENVLRGHDILTITRTWQFRSGEDFISD